MQAREGPCDAYANLFPSLTLLPTTPSCLLPSLQALEGFCKKNGVEVGDVTKEADAKGVEYCYVTVKDAEVSSGCGTGDG
jgi:hypothetical protein